MHETTSREARECVSDRPDPLGTAGIGLDDRFDAREAICIAALRHTPDAPEILNSDERPHPSALRQIHGAPHVKEQVWRDASLRQRQSVGHVVKFAQAPSKIGWE